LQPTIVNSAPIRAHEMATVFLMRRISARMQRLAMRPRTSRTELSLPKAALARPARQIEVRSRRHLSLSRRFHLKQRSLRQSQSPQGVSAATFLVSHEERSHRLAQLVGQVPRSTRPPRRPPGLRRLHTAAPSSTAVGSRSLPDFLSGLFVRPAIVTHLHQSSATERRAEAPIGGPSLARKVLFM